MPARRISYVIPAPQEPPPQFALPPAGVPRNGQTAPLLVPVTTPADSREPSRSLPRLSHPQHRLAVSTLALDTSTRLVDRPTPEGILYTSGRDGLVAAWELGVPMQKRAPRAKERRHHWEALTGWDEDDDGEESDEDTDEDGLDGIVRPLRPKRNKPPVDESGWAYEDRWEAAGDELKPAQFRQSVQLHTDWINDIVLCNMNRTIVSASSDGTLRTYNPHATDAPNILGTHADYARCLAYAPGPRWVASGSFDRTVKLWDISRAAGPSSDAVEYGPELTTLSLGDDDPKGSIYAVATDPAGSIVAAGGPERVVRIWDPRIPGAASGGVGGEPRCISALRGHTDNIRAVLVSEDGRYVLTGSSDASIKLWSLPMRRCIHTFSVHTDSVWALHSTHPQLHTFFSGDRGGWICRFDVTQPVGSTGGPSDTFNPVSSLQHNSGRSPTSTAFTSTHTPRHSISGTLNQLDKEREREMELSDAYCVVIGRAGYENQSANVVNGHTSHKDTGHGITALTAMDDTWVWAASGDSSVQRWRGVGAIGGMVGNWGSRALVGASLTGPGSAPKVGSSSPQRVGSPGPRIGSASSPPSSMVNTSSGSGRKRVSIEIPRADSTPHAQSNPEHETTMVAIPARVAPITFPSSPLRSAIGQHPTTPAPTQSSVLVPYTALIRLAEPNPFQLKPRDPETATLYSHSGISVHRNVHREDMAMGSGFFGLPASGSSLYTAPPLVHTSSLPLISGSSPGPGGPPATNHTNSTLPLASPPAAPAHPHPSTLPLAVDVSTVTPLSSGPADEIAGSHGLVRSVVLNDRVHALSVDTRGEVALWDVVRGICRGVFLLGGHEQAEQSNGQRHKISPREALDLVRDRIEGEAMTPAWASVDTRIGDLTVHLIEPRCFDAEVYADEVDWLGTANLGLEGEGEHRLNLGKWVLRNLFADFIQAELVLSAELAAPTPRATALGLPPAMAIPGLSSVAEGPPTASEEGINSIPGSPKPVPNSPALPSATPLALGGLPPAPPSPVVSVGARTPRVAHMSLTGRPTHIPLPTRTRSASEASMGGFGLGLGLGMMSPSGSGLGSATLAPMMTPAILPEADDSSSAPAPVPNLNTLSPIRELRSPDMLGMAALVVGLASPGEKPQGGGGDYFSAVKTGKEKDGPMGNDSVTPGGGGLMGRLKNLGKAGKRGAVTPGAVGTGGIVGGEATAAGNESEVEDKDPERTKHLNLLSSLLSNPLSPPQPHEAPPISFPPNTAVTISEATADASGWMAVFAGSTGTLGADVEALEMAIPGWLLEYLLAGRLNVPQGGAAGQKMGFMLLPWKGAKEVLPELVGSQSRLTASRFLRVSKVIAYVHDKLQGQGGEESETQANRGQSGEERRSQDSSNPQPQAGAGSQNTRPSAAQAPPRAGEEYEILCNEQVLNPASTLAAVRQYVWRNAGELVMHYRVKETQA